MPPASPNGNHLRRFPSPQVLSPPTLPPNVRITLTLSLRLMSGGWRKEKRMRRCSGMGSSWREPKGAGGAGRRE